MFLDVLQEKDIIQIRREIENLIVKFKPVIRVKIEENQITITVDMEVRSVDEQLKLRGRL